MNKSGIILLSLFNFMQISCALNSLNEPLVTLNATVVDEIGEPIKDASLTGVFPNARNEGEVDIIKTDENGHGEVSGYARFGVNLIINKDGYYEHNFGKIDTSEGSASGELTSRTRSFDVTLRRAINPRGLIAKRKKFEIPVKDEWAGYDLEQGDWVEPYGKGQQEDLLIRYENEFLGLRISEENLKRARELNSTGPSPWTEKRERDTYGNWSGEVEIKFPSEGEGIVKIVDGYLEHSQMKMPHFAPETGYEINAAWNGLIRANPPVSELGYFLRVRVVKRGDEIIQANYAKINEDIHFDPRGTISFSYYFNPDVNDRNLEFDPSKNLLKNVEWKERVKLP
tara:strand:+ start:3977 stop:4999 length:1023 start_codon:yes stop_codon:yes gene_type:complete